MDFIILVDKREDSITSVQVYRMTKQSVIMIFDVGKTNKKIFLFDDHYRLVFEDSVRLQETTDEDGFPCEDIDALTDWIRTSFERMLADERFDIRLA